MKGTIFVFFGLFCLLVQPFSVISQAPAPSPTPEINLNEAGLIHFGDLIDVDFDGTSEYDWRGSVSDDGVLQGLDEYGSVAALCRSEAEVAGDIARAYAKVLRDPKVTVSIIDRSRRAVAQLDGAVRVPARFRFQRPARLKELIVAAGGFTDGASGEIVILRADSLNCSRYALPQEKSPSGNGVQVINITIGELLSGKEEADPVILSGDLITVVKAVPIYVLGAVNDPRPILARSGMSVSRAVATAGGLAKGAVPQKVSIFRREGAHTTVIPVDLEKIKNGEINDVELKAFDIIEVAFKGRAQRKYPPVIAGGENLDSRAPELPLKIIE